MVKEVLKVNPVLEEAVVQFLDLKEIKEILVKRVQQGLKEKKVQVEI